MSVFLGALEVWTFDFSILSGEIPGAAVGGNSEEDNGSYQSSKSMRMSDVG